MDSRHSRNAYSHWIERSPQIETMRWLAWVSLGLSIHCNSSMQHRGRKPCTDRDSLIGWTCCDASIQYNQGIQYVTLLQHTVDNRYARSRHSLQGVQYIIYHLLCVWTHSIETMHWRQWTQWIHCRARSHLEQCTH